MGWTVRCRCHDVNVWGGGVDDVHLGCWWMKVLRRSMMLRLSMMLMLSMMLWLSMMLLLSKMLKMMFLRRELRREVWSWRWILRK